MLNKIRDQESIIMLFFAIMLVMVGIYVFIDRNVIDVIYLGVLGYYFGRFLIIRSRR